MKKSVFAFLAFALAGFATLNAQTITETLILRYASDSYAPDGNGKQWTVNNHTKLGNYYEERADYIQFNLYEFDFSSKSFAAIDSISCKNLRAFGTPDNGEAEIPEDLAAFSIEIFTGGTGNAKADYDGAKLTSVAKLTGLTEKDFVNGLVKLDGLGIDLSGENYFTFMISVDKTLVSQEESGGMGMENLTALFRITITGTEAIPEPATYAALIGAFALGFAICRRRK